MITVLDVISNFFGHNRYGNVVDIPGRDIWRFGEEVRRFSASYEPPPLDDTKYPAYLGGWPSANFFAASQGRLVLSTLLYSGQILAKDPISDWFSDEQYRVEHTASSRQGYLNSDGTPNIGGTRRFLANVVPALQALAPLIESGAIILVPGEAFFLQHQKTIAELHERLLQKLTSDPDLITSRFHPVDLAVDDRRRGAFVFAGGEKRKQLCKAIDRSLTYFAREWLLTQAHGAEYVAPWCYEQYVCQEGLDRLLTSNEHHKTVSALLRTRLPIFHGLNPKLVADIRDDPTFADFRSTLFTVYRGLPDLREDVETSKYLAQTEETQLRPILERAEREAKHGFLYRLGIQLTDLAFSIGARIGIDASTGELGWHTVASEGVGVLADRVRFHHESRSPISVWTKLYRHNRKVTEELIQVRLQPTSQSLDSPWAIDDQPSMNTRVTAGLLLFDEAQLPERPEPAGYSEGNYRACDCGSGLKWRFCCQGLHAR